MAEQLEFGKVIVYSLGVTACSVCAPAGLTFAEVTAEANRQEPTMISSPWKVSDAPSFKSGEPNPCPCDTEPDARRHYLMEC